MSLVIPSHLRGKRILACRGCYRNFVATGKGKRIHCSAACRKKSEGLGGRRRPEQVVRILDDPWPDVPMS